MSPFQPILDVLIREGFHLPATNEAGKPLAYTFTPYSLKSGLSFRFESLSDFKGFLEMSVGPLSEEDMATLQTSLMEATLKPDTFFYVNFFEQGKELEQ